MALAELRRHQKVTALELAAAAARGAWRSSWRNGRRAGPDLEELVWQRSAGNAFIAEETVRAVLGGDAARPAAHPARGRAEPHRGALARRAAGGAGDRGRRVARRATSCSPTCSGLPAADAAGGAAGGGRARRRRGRRERRGLPAAARPDDRGGGGRPAAGRAHRPAPPVRAGPRGERGVHAARPGRPARPPLVRGGRRGAGAGRAVAAAYASEGVHAHTEAHRHWLRAAELPAARGPGRRPADTRSAWTARPGPPSSAATTTRPCGCSTGS